MLRNILAVIAGYAALFLVVVAGLTGAYLLMGADKVFNVGNYEITTLWLIAWACVSILAAAAGGVVCSKVSKSSKGAVISLMILIGVLGAGNSYYMITREVPTEDLVRVGETSNYEAMSKAQAPNWVYIAEPIIGIVGVMLGAMAVCPCCKKSCND